VGLCNQSEQRIKVTHEIRKEEAVFLDITLVKLEDRMVKSKLFQKPTDRQGYLHVNSDHPEHTKKAIVKGQLRRLRGICSHECDFRQSARKLGERMEGRGYKKRVIEREYATIKRMPRKKALKKVERKREGGDKINFVTTFSSYLPNVKKILWDKFHHLQWEGLLDIITEPPRLSLR
jgi:hypothetical protein